MPTIKVGRVRAVFKGEYDPGSAYGPLERVLRNASLYESLQDVPAGALPETPGSIYWVPISAAGAPGKDGKDGKDGAPGLQGIPGPQGDKGPPGPQMPISDSLTSPDSGVAASSNAVYLLNQALEGVVKSIPEGLTVADVLTAIADGKTLTSGNFQTLALTLSVSSNNLMYGDNINGTVTGLPTATNWRIIYLGRWKNPSGQWNREFLALTGNQTWFRSYNESTATWAAWQQLSTTIAATQAAAGLMAAADKVKLDQLPVGLQNKNFTWAGQGGQPSYVWGSNDGANTYVWNPASFSVNYANSSGYAGNTGVVATAQGGTFGVGSLHQTSVMNAYLDNSPGAIRLVWRVQLYDCGACDCCGG